MPDAKHRVLAVCAHPVQYMSPVLRRMAQHPRLDFKVAYCSLRGAEAAYDPEFDATVQWDVPLLDGYDWVEIPNRGSGSESFFGLYNPGLWKLIREGRFDSVLIYTGYTRISFWISYLAAKFSGTSFIFGTDAISLVPKGGPNWKAYVKRLFWPLLFRLASQVIVPSSGSVDLMRSLGIPRDRISLTPFSVDNEWWIARSKEVDRDAVRAAWGVARETPVVLFCAKLQPWKRPLDLLQAFAQSKLENALLLFAGEGPLRPSLEKEAKALGVAERVRFLGFVNQTQLPALYTASDLLVFPSSFEPFGVVVNEAFLCGCLAAASDNVGAGRDLIAPVDPKLIFPCGDVAALTALLNEFLSDRPRLERLREVARKRMESWSPRENIEGAIAAIELATSRRSRHPDVKTDSSQPSPQKLSQ